MACPFSRRFDSLPRQGSITENAASAWNIEDDLADIPDDALALTHLQLAIQLLTAPSVSFFFFFFGDERIDLNNNFCPLHIQNDDINTAITSLIAKYSERWPKICDL